MNANSKIVDPKRGLARLVRPEYSPGLLLQDDDLTQAVSYTRELSRLMFRTLFGCGVMCGLVVKPTEECGKLHLRIAKGVAFDCHGDPIEVPETQDIVIDSTCGGEVPEELWIVIRRYEKCCAPRTAMCSPDDEEAASVCTRRRDGFEIRVLGAKPECSCGCEPSAATPGRIIVTDDFPMHPPADEAPAAAPAAAAAATNDEDSCLCADSKLDCYSDHYAGECACACSSCEWIVLARVDYDSDATTPWSADHRVRRFVRPVLMRDPQVALEQAAKTG